MVERQDRGFTFIELLIVIVILGILAAITIFAVGNVTDTDLDNSFRTEERLIRLSTAAVAIDGGISAGDFTADTGFDDGVDNTHRPMADDHVDTDGTATMVGHAGTDGTAAMVGQAGTRAA